MDKRVETVRNDLTLQNAPDILTVPEAAKLLRVGISKLYELVREDDLPAIRTGRSIGIPRAAISKFIEFRTGIEA